MHIGINEAVEIYARACRARYGRLARRVVREQASALLRRGDKGGADVWQRVAIEIEKSDGPAHGRADLPPRAAATRSGRA